MRDRVAYGIAAGTWGGRDERTLPPWALSAADVPRVTEGAFDSWVPPHDDKFEARPFGSRHPGMAEAHAE